MTTWKERLAMALVPKEARALTAQEALWGRWRSAVTATGLSVSEKSAVNVMEVATAIRVISNGFAQVPLKVYRKAGGDRVEADGHPLYKILHDRPNDEMTSFTLRQTLMGHLLTWGNAYCQIERNFFGEVIGLWPLLPDRTTPRRIDGKLWYETRISKDPAGVENNKTEWLPADEVLHIPGLGFDGLKGYSVISMIRENVGLAGAYQEMAARFFSNDATPGFMLATDQKLGDPQYARLNEQFNEGHQGLRNKFKPYILEGGLKPVTVSMPLEDAEFIESRKFERWTIFGYYGIPPHMVADTEKSSSWGTGISEMSAGFIKFTMDPWFVCAEQAINAKLLGANAQGPLFCEFDREGFQRGAFKDRIQGYKELWGMGVASNAYIARLENLPKPPVELWLVPSNVISIKQVEPKVQKDIDAPDALAIAAAQPKPDANKPKADSGEGRAALMRAQRHVLIDVVDRILRRERVDVSQKVTKLLSKPDELTTWLDSFYKEHRTFARKQIAPAIETFAEAIRADVARELDKDVPPFSSFIRGITDGVAGRVATVGEVELRKQILSGEPTWSRAAEEVVERELVQIGNAFAKAAYRSAGVPLIVWVARDSCSDCQTLDRHSVAIGEQFRDGIGHPPLCEDCTCVIMAKHSTRTEPEPTTTVVRVEMEPAAAPIVNFTQPPQVINVAPSPAPEVHITNQVNPTPVTVRNDIPVPSVSVSPTPIEVKNNLPPMSVTVEQPRRGSKIVRDKKGIITGVEPTED